MKIGLRSLTHAGLYNGFLQMEPRGNNMEAVAVFTGDSFVPRP